MRSNSLRSGSLRGAPVQRPQTYHHRQNSADLASFAEHDDEGDGVVITTKTTKVMDSLGRTRSITTETIKTLPDGSNIIETKTTNISRPTSRSNSLRSNSLRNNSLSHGINANYNLDKIEEDLHDFDYTYLDHDDGHSPPPLLNQESHQQSPRTQKYIQEQRNALAPEFPMPFKPEERAASLSSNQSSPRRLKSILKNGSSQMLPLQDGREEGASIHDVIALNGNTFSATKSAAIDVPQQNSVASGGASIKFRETVETISYPVEAHNLAELLREEEFKKDQEKQKNVDMYSQAMKVAMEKVYGKNEENTTALHKPPQSSLPTESKKDLDALAEKKLKKDQKRDKAESGGVSKNYVYENHHRDFSIRSLRSGPVAEDGHVSTRKERAKEEKRHLKEEDKRNAELLKNAEKERKKEEKLQKKKDKKSFSFFGKKKQKDTTADDSLVSEQAPSPVAPIVLTPDGNARDVYVSSEKAPVVQSPSTVQREGYSSPRQEAIIDSREEAQLPEDGSIAERSSLFVDVPEFADEVEENPRVEVIEQKVRPPPSISEITTDPNVPPRGDIAELQREDLEVPPRADLQLLNSTDVQVIPIAEEQLPTLVSGINNHLQILLDETIDDAGILDAAEAKPGLLEYSVPNVITPEEPKSAVVEDAPEVLVSEKPLKSEHTPNKIAKPELQPLDERPSVGQLSDLLPEDQAFSSGSSELSPDKVNDEISNEPQNNFVEPERLRNLITDTHNAVGGIRKSAASEESERTLRSSPVVFKAPQGPQVVHTSQGESVDASADHGQKQMESTGSDSSPGAPLVTTTGKTTSPLAANELERHEESFGGEANPAMYSQQESSLGSPIQLTLATQNKAKSDPEPTTFKDESKKSSKKRTHRFKKMIDKYFINNYSK